MRIRNSVEFRSALVNRAAVPILRMGSAAYPGEYPVSDFAQTVKQQADIVKVIEGYIRLRKAGAQNYSGPLPVPQRKIAVVLRARGAPVLLLLRLPRIRRCLQLCGKD